MPPSGRRPSVVRRQSRRPDHADATIKSIDAQGVVFVEQWSRATRLDRRKFERRCDRQQRSTDEKPFASSYCRPPCSGDVARASERKAAHSRPRAAQGSPLRRFSGTPIDVDYQAANLRTVLRNLSEIGGINLVHRSERAERGATVDLKLAQVPWDQVMDVVLKRSAADLRARGPVLRVLTREARTKELQAEDGSQKTREPGRAGSRRPRRIRLNYATAADVKKLLEDARLISERGTRRVRRAHEHAHHQGLAEERSTKSRQLVAELDRPEPQVEIEAKILQTNRDTAKALGVQWGFNGRVAPELGNTTDLGVPEPRHARRPRRRRRARRRRARTTRAPTRTRAIGHGRQPAGRRRDVGARPVDGRDQRRVRSRRGASRRSSTTASSRFCRRRA